MQNVDYLGADASRLDLDFQVLVPTFVPAPFGIPSVSAGSGSYSLYWMVEGGPPTFLYVTGEAGGSLPAGSPYDFNNELSVNARVQGFEAIHDVTPDYDAVWWIANGVLYSVESMNMTGSDTMSLANGLIPLAAPPVTDETSPEPTEGEPDPTVQPPDAIDPSLPGIPPPLATKPAATTESEPAPTAESRQTAEPEPTSPATGVASTPTIESTEQSDVSVSGETIPAGTPAPTTVAPVAGEVLTATPSAAATPGAVNAPESSPVATPGGMSSDGTGSPVIPSDGTGSPIVPSDGTGGPPPPTTGSDGTGGTSDLSLTP